MDGAQLLKSLDMLSSLGINKLIVTGGEPLMRRELTGLLARAGELGMARLVLTNGDMLDDRAARDLVACGLEGVSISVHCITDARRVEHAAMMLHESGMSRVTATIVFTRGNASDVRPLYDWAKERGMGTIIQPAYLPRGSRDSQALSPRYFTQDQWDMVAPVLREWGEATGASAYVGFVLSLYGQGPCSAPALCSMGSGAVVLDSDGMLYPCFHRYDMPAGTIRHDGADSVIEKLRVSGADLKTASCYGEHCVSLFIAHQSI